MQPPLTKTSTYVKERLSTSSERVAKIIRQANLTPEGANRDLFQAKQVLPLAFARKAPFRASNPTQAILEARVFRAGVRAELKDGRVYNPRHRQLHLQDLLRCHPFRGLLRKIYRTPERMDDVLETERSLGPRLVIPKERLRMPEEFKDQMGAGVLPRFRGRVGNV